MATKIKFNIFKFLFRLFSFLADKTGGWVMFVKPKLLLGTLIMGLGVTACAPKEKKTETETEKVISDTINAANTEKDSTKQVKNPIKSTITFTSHQNSKNNSKAKNNKIIETEPEIIDYDVMCYSGPGIIENDTINAATKVYDMVEQMPQFPDGE
jgi:hypothetical protein